MSRKKLFWFAPLAAFTFAAAVASAAEVCDSIGPDGSCENFVGSVEAASPAPFDSGASCTCTTYDEQGDCVFYIGC